MDINKLISIYRLFVWQNFNIGIMYLLTEWEGQTWKYLAQSQDESQIFSSLAWPHSVDKHFIIWQFFSCRYKIVSHCFCGAVCISSTCFSGPISPQRIRPSFRNFFLMDFQGNYARGHTGHMTIYIITWLKAGQLSVNS